MVLNNHSHRITYHQVCNGNTSRSRPHKRMSPTSSMPDSVSQRERKLRKAVDGLWLLQWAMNTGNDGGKNKSVANVTATDRKMSPTTHVPALSDREWLRCWAGNHEQTLTDGPVSARVFMSREHVWKRGRGVRMCVYVCVHVRACMRACVRVPCACMQRACACACAFCACTCR